MLVNDVVSDGDMMVFRVDCAPDPLSARRPHVVARERAADIHSVEVLRTLSPDPGTGAERAGHAPEARWITGTPAIPDGATMRVR